MKNGSIREFLQQKAVKTGAVVLASALVLTSSSWSGIFRNEPEFTAEAELPIYIDPADSVISPEPVPGPPAPKVTKKTKTNKTTKKVKLKQKSKKTYTKKSKGKKQTTTSRQVTSEATTTVKTETTTSLTSKFKKGSNINTQTTTVKTVTTTTVQANNPAGGNSVVSSTVQASSQNASAGPVQIGAAAPRVDSRVARAYTTLGFTINVDPNVNYSGVCDVRSRSITLKKSGDTVYHELGHFLAFIAGNVDKSAAFNQVFAQEKDKYTEFNKAYVLQNTSEYFAESFKNYTLNPNELRASRPMTYAAIESALNSVSDAQIARIKTVYGAVWGV